MLEFRILAADDERARSCLEQSHTLATETGDAEGV